MFLHQRYRKGIAAVSGVNIILFNLDMYLIFNWVSLKNFLFFIAERAGKEDIVKLRTASGATLLHIAYGIK